MIFNEILNFKQSENSSSAANTSTPLQHRWSTNNQTRPRSSCDLHTAQSLLSQKPFRHITGYKQQVRPQGMNLEREEYTWIQTNRNKCWLCVFDGLQVESVEKLFGILSSDTVDISLRRSAAEQLSVVLQGELPVKDKKSVFQPVTGYTCHKTSTMFFIVAPHKYLQACVTAKMDKHSTVANTLHPVLEQLGWEWNWAWYSISTRSVYLLDINNLRGLCNTEVKKNLASVKIIVKCVPSHHQVLDKKEKQTSQPFIYIKIIVIIFLFFYS